MATRLCVETRYRMKLCWCHVHIKVIGDQNRPKISRTNIALGNMLKIYDVCLLHIYSKEYFTGLSISNKITITYLLYVMNHYMNDIAIHFYWYEMTQYDNFTRWGLPYYIRNKMIKRLVFCRSIDFIQRFDCCL